MFKSVIDAGTVALRSATLINGGAAVALLAFIGNIWEKGVAEEAVAHIELVILNTLDFPVQVV